MIEISKPLQRARVGEILQVLKLLMSFNKKLLAVTAV